jgi:outer membrane protein assembly factor BamB
MYKKLIHLSIYFIFFVGCLPIKETSLSTAIPEQKYHHEILENDLHFIPVWEKTGLVLQDFSGKVAMAFLDDYLILVDYSKGSLSPRLIALNIQTGEQAWETPLPEPHLSFLSNQKSIFISAGRSILSYDSKTGTLNWENKNLLPTYKIYAMQIDNDRMYAYYTEEFLDNRTQVIYTLDINTGELLNTQKSPDVVTRLWFQNNNAGYWVGANEILSVDQTTSQVRWQTSLETTGITVETIDQGIILLISHMGDALYAIDMESGNLKWIYNQQLISNSVIIDTTVFFLISGEKLIGLDLNSGEIKGSIHFSQQDNVSNANSPEMVVSHNLMAVYFGDNSQLEVFKIPK